MGEIRSKLADILRSTIRNPDNAPLTKAVADRLDGGESTRKEPQPQVNEALPGDAETESPFTHTVSIPLGNGYRDSMHMLSRVVDHIRQLDPTATLDATGNDPDNIRLKVSKEKEFVVTGALRSHYGFVVTPK